MRLDAKPAPRSSQLELPHTDRGRAPQQPAQTAASAIYFGAVRHVRSGPVAHRFRFRLALLYLDLDELPLLFARRWLWSIERWNIASYCRADYYQEPGRPELDLAAAVRARVTRELGRTPAGPIRMLTQLRCAGFVFNPVTFYYCFDIGPAGAEPLAAIAAEITNTPWGERHMYVLDAQAGSSRVSRARIAKEFHVSPFQAMTQIYEWFFTTPSGALGSRLAVHMQNHQDARRVLHVSLALRRRALTGTTLAWFLIAYPFQAMRTVATIYWNALRLKVKGARFYSHPRTEDSAAPTLRSDA
ncbi:MAG: DUF1365 domain-containing protein [Planctomycetota bacterium]